MVDAIIITLTEHVYLHRLNYIQVETAEQFRELRRTRLNTNRSPGSGTDGARGPLIRQGELFKHHRLLLSIRFGAKLNIGRPAGDRSGPVTGAHPSLH